MAQDGKASRNSTIYFARNIGSNFSMETQLKTGARFLTTKPIFSFWLLISLGAMILLVPAILNGFPFVFEDSSDYLVFTPQIYRSPYYGLFIFVFHLNTCIWLAVVVQSLILSHLIFTWIRFTVATHQLFFFLTCIICLVLFSSLPFVSTFLMADVFTSIMVLSIGLLAFHSFDLSYGELTYFFLLSCIAIAAHVSHFAIAIGLLAVVLIVFVIQGRRLYTVRRPISLVGSAILLSAAAFFINNIAVHGVAALSPASPTFILANWIEHGPARRYLVEVCPHGNYKICSHLEEMPDASLDILWRTDFYSRLGGFKGMREEAGQIVVGTVQSRPREVVVMALKLIAGAFERRAPGAELRPVGNGPFLEETLRKRFGTATLEAYRSSAQYSNAVPRNLLKGIDLVVFPVSLMLVVSAIVASVWYRQKDQFAFCVLILSGVIFNIVLCAVASGVYERYQWRVSWLLPFAVLLVVGRMMEESAARAPGASTFSVS